MSFLYQAAKLVQGDSSRELLLSRYYASEAKNIAKRHVLRTDPALKSMFCKRCSAILDTSKIRFRKAKPCKLEC